MKLYFQQSLPKKHLSFSTIINNQGERPRYLGMYNVKVKVVTDFAYF